MQPFKKKRFVLSSMIANPKTYNIIKKVLPLIAVKSFILLKGHILGRIVSYDFNP